MPSDDTTETDSERDSDTDEQPETATESAADEPEVVDAERLSETDFDDQEWTLGEERTGVIEFNGMKFRVAEPETDDQVAELVSPSADASLINKRALKILIEEPALTDEQIEERMTPKERALLANECMEWYGLDDFIDEEALSEALAERERQQNGQSDVAVE